jgi:hypothetical protein
MPFRIETAARGRFTVLILSGRFEGPGIAELRKLLEGRTDLSDIVFDLKDVSLIDREVVLYFLRCEADGVKLENCASYIREWIKRERVKAASTGARSEPQSRQASRTCRRSRHSRLSRPESRAWIASESRMGAPR